MFIFFFFSSRRRHTRFKCDWSSDVCSSDLVLSRARSPSKESVAHRRHIFFFNLTLWRGTHERQATPELHVCGRRNGHALLPGASQERKRDQKSSCFVPPSASAGPGEGSPGEGMGLAIMSRRLTRV